MRTIRALQVLAILLVNNLLASSDWASDTLATMSIEQKIGQLFVTAICPSHQFAVLTRLYEDYLIRNLHVGGVFLKYRWDYQQEQERIEQLQELAQTVPLFIAQDFERGLGSRIDDALTFPKNMTLGALTDDAHLETMGELIGAQSRAIGVNLVLAPVVDVNTNPLNPVIHLRSFGENERRVAKKGAAVMRGLQKAGVLACAKHFPGHGDSSKDSHCDLPYLGLTRDRLEVIELYPFRKLIEEGVACVMTAHLTVSALDSTGLPASLSHEMTTKILREELGFDGLIITDDLLMGAISKNFEAGEACKRALIAGSDLIMTSNGAIEGIEAIKQALQSGEISEGEIDGHVLRILRAKQALASKPLLPQPQEVSKILFREAVTLLENNGCVPVSPDRLPEWAFVQIGGAASEPFWNALDPAHPVCSAEDLPKEPVGVIAALFPPGSIHAAEWLASVPESDGEIGHLWSASHLLRDFCTEHKIPLILLWFGSPYGLRGIATGDAQLLLFEDVAQAQLVAAEAVIGAIPIRGRLPVSIGEQYCEGAGLTSEPVSPKNPR